MGPSRKIPYRGAPVTPRLPGRPQGTAQIPRAAAIWNRSAPEPSPPRVPPAPLLTGGRLKREIRGASHPPGGVSAARPCPHLLLEVDDALHSPLAPHYAHGPHRRHLVPAPSAVPAD